MDRLAQQIAFLKEIDTVKSIVRRSRLMDNSRYENDAEHSWHLAVMAMVLAEHAESDDLDLARVIKMVLIHDVVEIDAGDTFFSDSAVRAEKAVSERQAAERIFGLLPTDQCAEFRALWDEFEARETSEARFAASLDRLEPCIQNACTEGHSWRKHRISRQAAEAANAHIADGSTALWQYARSLYAEADAKGWFSGESTEAEDAG